MRRPFLVIPALGLLVLVAVIVPARAWWDGPAIDRVEEDWELVIAAPDVVGAGPQITTYMAPARSESVPFALFNVNYRDQPSFAAGGLQVQAWESSTLLSYDGQRWEQCATDQETIRWTQRMALSGGQVQFDIISGQSTTWGQFGQGDNLRVFFPVSLDTLADYSPDRSAARSQVGWQSNRVTSLTLKRVRYYNGSNLVSTDENERAVKLGE